MIINKKKIIKVKKLEYVTYQDYKINPSKFLKHIPLHVFLSKALDFCVEEFSVMPLEEEFKIFLETWNEIKNSRFQKIKMANIKANSNVYNLNQLAFTYRYIQFNLNSSEQIVLGIKNFNFLAEKHPRLKYKKKLNPLQNYLYGDEHINNMPKWFEICLLERTEIYLRAFPKGRRPKHLRTFEERVKPIFLETFFPGNPQLGLTEFYAHFDRFSAFSDRMVEDHSDRFICGWSITKYIEKYFALAKKITDDINFEISIPYILGDKMRGQFIRNCLLENSKFFLLKNQ